MKKQATSLLHTTPNSELSPFILSQSSIRFATRIAFVFIIRDEIVQAATWADPGKSICLGLTLTLFSLYPLTIGLILFVCVITMMPNNLKRDFTSNLRDLQNSMTLYCDIYDKMVAFRENWCHYVSPKIISSIVFAGVCSVFLLASLRITIDRYLPLLIWVSLLALHPAVRKYFGRDLRVRQSAMQGFQLRNETAIVWSHSLGSSNEPCYFTNSPDDNERTERVTSLDLVLPPTNYNWAPNSRWKFVPPDQYCRHIRWSPTASK
ncbi:peroxin Pex28/29 [Schizosaccharomyces japonicus yFS275]|uniref:Peroxin Pex28/29 n=1 Tax=Schizosaccharomyces japonicus (strain yFS275 / FY16936) TaxID=402676 RepID=B6K4D7_SCHJY|nr:peroxin Pex28/29 [Schizosaccharomyces japonicus yFS275]EEB08344.1 peroxin Pex28/29 [Schizosaccharomyces japonicus yFS275]